MTMIEPASRVQEKFHGLHPANTGIPAEAGAYAMYLFYRWQTLGGEGSHNAMSRELSGVYTRIRALLRDMDARKESYDPRDLYTWVDRYVLLRRVAGGGPFDERELDVLRLRYCEGWLSGETGYKATYAVSQVIHWEKNGSRLVTQRLSDAARLAIEEWRDELSNRPEAADIDSPETLRKLSLLRGTGTVWNPRKAGKLLPVVERVLSRTVSSFSTKSLEALQPLSLFLDERWPARHGHGHYAIDILDELTRRPNLSRYARKSYMMLREILVECNGNFTNGFSAYRTSKMARKG